MDSSTKDPVALLIRLDPYIPVGVPITVKRALPVQHFERLSVILKGSSFEAAAEKYPEIGRLLDELTAG